MKRYELIIFDIYGIILDLTKGIHDAMYETIKIKSEETEKIKEETEKMDIQSFTKALCETLCETYRTLYMSKYYLDSTLYDGIIDTISTLSQTRYVAIVTNMKYDFAKTQMDNFGITQYCKAVKGTDYENKLKKSDLVKQCLDELNIKPADAVMIGNTTEDINSAKEVGVDFIAVTYGFGFRKGDIEPSADSPKELLEMLQ